MWLPAWRYLDMSKGPAELKRGDLVAVRGAGLCRVTDVDPKRRHFNMVTTYSGRNFKECYANVTRVNGRPVK